MQLFRNLQTGAWLAPLSMGILQAKNTGGVCYALLQGIFPTQRSNPGLQHCRQILYYLSHQGSPLFTRLLPNKKGKPVFRCWVGLGLMSCKQLGETWQAHRHRSSCNGVRLLLFIYFNWRLITVLWWLWSLLRMVKNPPIMWETWVRSLG